MVEEIINNYNARFLQQAEGREGSMACEDDWAETRIHTDNPGAPPEDRVQAPAHVQVRNPLKRLLIPAERTIGSIIQSVRERLALKYSQSMYIFFHDGKFGNLTLL